MSDNVIDLSGRRNTASPTQIDPFEGTALATLRRVRCTRPAMLTVTAQGMKRPVSARMLVDATWLASEIIDQIQVLLLREPRRNATLTRADGTVVGDSEFLWFTGKFLESHATTIEEATEGGAVLEFDPITGWKFDVSLRTSTGPVDLNAGQLVELQEQQGAVPLNYSPEMADGVLELFDGGEPSPRVLAELLTRDRIVHFPPPESVDARGQLLVYYVLRELELNPEYMQVIDLVPEKYPEALVAFRELVRLRMEGPSDLEDAHFLREFGFVYPESDAYHLAPQVDNLFDLHPYYVHYAVLGSYCKMLDQQGKLSEFPEWNPSPQFGFAEFDLQAYAEMVSQLGEQGEQPRP